MLSYETYALVSDMVDAHSMPPIRMKGISREIVPYAVDGLASGLTARTGIFAEHSDGLDLVLDIEALDAPGVELVKRRLAEALRALDLRTSQPA